MAEGAQPFARAVFEAKSGSTVSGNVDFAKTMDGIIVRVTAQNVEKGKHGFHVHEKGDCSAPDASSAGEHFILRATRTEARRARLGILDLKCYC